MTATDDGSGHLVLSGNSPNTTFTVSGAEQAAFGLSGSAVSGTSSTRTTLQSNYNALLTQIDQLAGDASYNGVNLLNGNNLTVNFNETGTSSLTINGVTFNPAGLGLSSIAAGGFQSNSTITGGGNRDQYRDHHRACPDRDVRHQLVDDLDSSDLRPRT